MEIKCPTCKKINEDSEICKRCKCELIFLFSIKRMAQKKLTEAYHYLKSHNYDRTEENARLSWNLKHTPEAAQMLFFASLGMRKYEEATIWFHQIKTFIR